MLDKLRIKPVDIYGDEQQIVRLLSQLHVVDENMLVSLSSSI